MLDLSSDTAIASPLEESLFRDERESLIIIIIKWASGRGANCNVSSLS